MSPATASNVARVAAGLFSFAVLLLAVALIVPVAVFGFEALLGTERSLTQWLVTGALGMVGVGLIEWSVPRIIRDVHAIADYAASPSHVGAPKSR